MEKILCALMAFIFSATMRGSYADRVSYDNDIIGEECAIVENIDNDTAYSDYRYPVYQNDAVPGYTQLDYFQEKLGSLFVFCDQTGTVQWRIFAERDVLNKDGEIVRVESGFLPCTVKNVVIRINGDPSCKIEITEDASFVDLSAETFGTATKGKSKDKNIVDSVFYGTYDSENYSYMFPMQNDEPATGAIPVKTTSKGVVTFTVPGGDSVTLATGKMIKNK